MQRMSQQAFYKWYFSNQTSLMQLKSQLLSAHLQRCLFYRARNCMKILFGIFDTKGHIHDGEVYHVHQDTFGFTLVWEFQGWDRLQNISRITQVHHSTLTFPPSLDMCTCKNKPRLECHSLSNHVPVINKLFEIFCRCRKKAYIWHC